MATPSKQPGNSTMTHEEEELQPDISELRDKEQQISLSQRETKDDMDGLKGDMDGLKVYIKDLKDGLKVYMEVMMNVIMEG